jgi:hypothetical protein
MVHPDRCRCTLGLLFSRLSSIALHANPVHSNPVHRITDLRRKITMPALAQEMAAIVPAAVYARLRRESNLAAMTQELSGLRFSIILLARWEAARTMDARNMVELRRELKQMRTLYSDKIDTMAMTFGVQQAMDTKADVERSVVVPKNMAPLLRLEEQEQLYF